MNGQQQVVACLMSVDAGNETTRVGEKREEKSPCTYTKTCNPTVYDLVPASTGAHELARPHPYRRLFV